MAGIYAINIDEYISERQYQWLCSSAGKNRRHKAERYRFISDKKRCIYADALLRYIIREQLGRNISTSQLAFNEYGKPFLPHNSEFCFNISHSGRWVICGWSRSAIGVDVEQMSRVEPDVARMFFHPDEYRAIMASETAEAMQDLFFSIWTLKESYVKYLGKGVSVPLDSFRFALDGRKILFSARQAPNPFFRLLDMDDNHKAAICMDAAPPQHIQTVSLDSICTKLAG